MKERLPVGKMKPAHLVLGWGEQCYRRHRENCKLILLSLWLHSFAICNIAHVNLGLQIRNTCVRTQIWHKPDQADATGQTGVPQRSDRWGVLYPVRQQADRSDRWTPSPSRIEESLRISSCKRIPCGARPPHPVNIKGHDRLRGRHPTHYFLQLLSLKP
jgi:hypothetical protein